MLFLLNNPLIALIGVLAIGLSVFILRKIIVEIKLNNQLREKHKAMRIKGIDGGFRKRVSGLGALALAPTAVFAVALIIGFNITPNTDESNVVGIRSANDIISIYDDFQAKWESGYNFRGGMFTVDEALEAMPEDAAPTVGNDVDTADKGSDDHSEVNNQVEGVDEMDNVITDGLYIYSIYGNQVQVSKAWTQSMGSDALELLHTFDYTTEYSCDATMFYPMGLYEEEGKLIVVGSETQYTCYDSDKWEDGAEEPMYDYWYGYAEDTRTKVLVYSKTDFELEEEYTVKGNFIGTRKIGSDLYIVTNQWIPFGNEDLDLDTYLPYYEVDNQKVMAQYEDIVYVDGTTPNAFTAFYAIDLDNSIIDMEVVLGDSGYNLYVSSNNMYLVGNIYYFWPMAEVVDVEEPVYEQKTAIMRIGINATSVEFDGLGYVDGYIENQFSMDEYDGHLRVTTTVGWWGDVVNYLWVLDDDMKVVGQLGGRDLEPEKTLGEPGETIRATRFAGEYAYVVTFLQTDPFYVINLSDPTNPFIEGELKIDGFSEHLQVLDEDHVLGIGFEADPSTGQTIGLKFNIYDVSDKSNPIEAFDNPAVFLYEDSGYMWTSALWNHKDLLVNLDKGLLAMPFSTNGWDDSTERWYYNSGILVFDLSLEEGIGEHKMLIHEQNSYFDCYVYKSLFISDQFYTVSNKYIKSITIDDIFTNEDVNITDFNNSVTLREFEYQNDPWGEPKEVDPVED